MTQLPLYIDTATAERADPAALADVQATPAKRNRGWYPETDEDWERARQIAFGQLARAQAAGTHSPAVRDVCTVCRQWCDGIYFSESGGGGGVAGTKHYCQACYLRLRPGPDPDAEPVAKPQHIAAPRKTFDRRAVPTFADILCLWSSVHYREAFEAFPRSTEWEWEARVLASIVRRRAAVDPAWLFRVAVHPRYWEDLILLAPQIVRAGGYPIAEGQTFDRWVREYRAAWAAGLVN